MKKLIRSALWLLLPLGAYILTKIATLYPNTVETLYSRTIYPVLARIFGAISGFFPFSLGELFLYVFVILVAIRLVWAILGLIFVPLLRLITFFRRILSIIVLAGLLYTSFVLGWGLNFYRMPLSNSMGYSNSLYTTAELYDVTVRLAQYASALRQAVPEENGCFTINESRQEIREKVGAVFNENARDFMNLSVASKVKGVYADSLLSAINSQGIYCPFTYESNINMQMPDLFFASTCAHEFAHLQGFCREDEAEFISFYVSYRSSDPNYAYSSAVNALNHALNALAGEDRELYAKACKEVCAGIWRDFEQHTAYWKNFESPVSEASDTLNDNYLKFHEQTDGIKSYGRMLDLILEMDRAKELNLSLS